MKNGQPENDLRQAQKMEVLGQIAGGVAHDFNNILQAIQGFTELARDPAITSEERDSALMEVMMAADRAAQMTRQLLAFGRRQTLEVTDTDVVELTQHLTRMLRRLLGEMITLSCTAIGKVPHVRCDRTQIEQVLMNLCLNARDAMPNGGRIRITIQESAVPSDLAANHTGSFVQIKVTDTGAGMDQKTLARIYEPFFTTKGPGKGSGLGLSVVYGIIQQHHGVIHAESEPGKGTTFCIFLPAGGIARAPEKPVRKTRRELGAGELILVAEDDPALRELSRRVLEKAGFRTVCVQNGLEAVETFRRRAWEFALVIFDMMMPQMGGAAAYRAIAAIRPEVPVLFCSGYNEVFPEDEKILPENASFLQKPYRPDDLLGRIRQLLSPAQHERVGMTFL